VPLNLVLVCGLAEVLGSALSPSRAGEVGSETPRPVLSSLALHQNRYIFTNSVRKDEPSRSIPRIDDFYCNFSVCRRFQFEKRTKKRMFRDAEREEKTGLFHERKGRKTMLLACVLQITEVDVTRHILSPRADEQIAMNAVA
jgi:hypothetical protein